MVVSGSLNGRGWIGITLLVWPLIRSLALGFGLDLPDLGPTPDFLTGVGYASQGVGTALLANAKPIGKKATARVVKAELKKANSFIA